jgi:TolB-like protein
MIATVIALLFSCAAPAPVSDAPPKETLYTLDESAYDFAAYLSGRFPANSSIAVFGIDAPVQALADYFVDELITRLVNETPLDVISRQNLERIKLEQNFQKDPHFDDETSVRIGHLAGWRTVIIGSVNPLEQNYRLVLRAIDVETGKVSGAKSYSLKSDPVLISLINPQVTVQQLASREQILKPFSGAVNNFELRVWPGKNVYYDNEELFINLWAAEDCYFVIFQVDVENRMQAIYPNVYDPGNNTLKAGITRTIPEDSSFVLHAPYGEERILVYASKNPISIPDEQYNPRPISDEFLSAPTALWRTERAPSAGEKALSILPRGATGQFSYSILPRF